MTLPRDDCAFSCSVSASGSAVPSVSASILFTSSVRSIMFIACCVASLLIVARPLFVTYLLFSSSIEPNKRYVTGVLIVSGSDDTDKVVAGLTDRKLAVGLGVCQPSLRFPSYTMHCGMLILLTGGRSDLLLE